MIRPSKTPARLLIAASLGAAFAGSGGSIPAHAAGTAYDYLMVMDHSDYVGIAFTDTNGSLKGGAIDYTGSDCKGTLNGTLMGTSVNFQVVYSNIFPCGGATITFTGTLSPTQGHGTYTTSFGTSGTWVASDRRS